MENNETFEYYYNKYGERPVRGKASISLNPDRYIEINKTHQEIVFSNDIHASYWHRLDGPAYISSCGNEWWINDNGVTEEITQWAKENDIDLDNLTSENINLIKIIWSDYGKT